MSEEERKGCQGGRQMRRGEGKQSQIDAKATWQSKLHSGSEPELRLCCVRTHTNVTVCVWVR